MTTTAERMGVREAPGIDPLSPAARRALNHVLVDLDPDERSSLVLMSAVGPWDWHMVDGTGRVWHFRYDGKMSWNEIDDNAERAVLRRAEQLGWKGVEE